MQLLINFSVQSRSVVGGGAEFCLDQTERITWLTGAIFSTAQVPYNEWMFDLSIIIIIISIPMRVFCNSHDGVSFVMLCISSECGTNRKLLCKGISFQLLTNGRKRSRVTDKSGEQSKSCVFTSDHRGTVTASCSPASIVSCCQQLSGVIDDTLGEWLAQWFNCRQRCGA